MAKIVYGKFIHPLRPVSFLRRKPRITVAKLIVRDIRIHLFVGTLLQVCCAVVIRISREYRALKAVLRVSYLVKILFRPIDHGRKMSVILPIAEGFAVYDDLMGGIYQGLTVIALIDEMNLLWICITGKSFVENE